MADAIQSTMPWDDCKVAFGCDNEEALWRARERGTLRLPHGWSLDGTDASGARCVVLFRVDGAVWPEDGNRVRSALRRVGAISQRAALTQAASTGGVAS